MNGRDQAFINAYAAAWESAGEDPPPASRREAIPQPADVAAANPHYRLDRRSPRQAIVPPPHGRLASGAPSAPVASAYTIEVSTWDVSAAAAPAVAIVSAPILPEAKDAKPASEPLVEKHAKSPSEPLVEKHAKPPSEPLVEKRAKPTASVVQAEPTTPAPIAKPAPPPVPGPLLDTPARLKPVWEVDRFSWPADTNRLYEAESAYFQHAGEKLREASQEGLHVLAVASSQPGDGCTTLAICLARAAASAGIKVALMDANLEHPELADRLSIKFPQGWQDALDGTVPLGEVAITSLADGVTLVPLNARHANRSFSLHDAQVVRLIQTVAAGVNLLIMDLGSSDWGDDGTEVKAPRSPVNAAIVVRDVRRASQRDTLSIATRLKESGVEAVGIAENHACPPAVVRKTAA